MNKNKQTTVSTYSIHFPHSGELEDTVSVLFLLIRDILIKECFCQRSMITFTSLE